LSFHETLKFLIFHKFKIFKEIYPNLKLPITEEISERELTIPLYPSMKEEDINYVIEKIKEFFK